MRYLYLVVSIMIAMCGLLHVYLDSSIILIVMHFITAILYFGVWIINKK